MNGADITSFRGDGKSGLCKRLNNAYRAQENRFTRIVLTCYYKRTVGGSEIYVVGNDRVARAAISVFLFHIERKPKVAGGRAFESEQVVSVNRRKTNGKPEFSYFIVKTDAESVEIYSPAYLFERLLHFGNDMFHLSAKTGNTLFHKQTKLTVVDIVKTDILNS